jgi:hypothetical protein
MATYYWVGGTGTWDSTTTTNWAATSGGAGGAGVPTSADNVIFDDNSGTGTVSIETAVCNDWTCTRTTGTNIITFGGSFKIDVYGSITWSNTTLTAISVTAAGGYIICYGASGTKTLNFGGKTAEVSLELKPSSSAVVYSLSSAANFGELRVQGGTFTTNNNAITIAIPNAYRDGSFTVDSGPLSQPITCNFGSSAISVANNVYFIAANGILTLNFGTSVITTVNSTTSVNFESSYTGAGTYAIDTTSTAGHAIRPNGDLYMVILGSVPVRLLLQQIGNTTGNTVNYFRIGGDLPTGSIVTLGGTTNCNDFLGQSGTVTFTGAVVVTNLFTADYNITLTCSSTLSAANIQLDSNNNILFSGVVTTTTGNINTTTRGTTTFNGVTCAGTFTSSDVAGTCGAITFNGTTTVNGAMTLAGGGLVTINGASTIFSFARSNGSLTLAAVTYTIRSSWYMQAGYTLTRSTSTIALSGLDLASAAIDTTFDSGGYTYQNVSIAGNLQTIQDTTGGSTALACAGTFTGTTLTNTYGVLNLTIGLSVTGALSLTGNSLVNRYFVRSNVHSTARSITRASNTLTNVDFSDITFTGAAATGTSLGNCLGNTNITFTAAVNRFARASGDWSSTAVWSATSGGATGATAPLPQDTVIFNAASGSITVNTADRRALGVNLFTAGFNGTINVNNTGLRGSFIYGTIQTSTTTTITGTDAIIMAGRNALYNIEIRRAISVPVVVYGCNATYTVTNPLSTTGAVSITAGTFDLLANPLTCASLSTWYTPYSAFMPALSPDPSPITVNLNANTVTVSGDISNDWQNYPNTPQSIATVNATNATISAANIVFRYATFNTGTSNISLTGNIELGYPAGNPSSLTGNSNITFGPSSSSLSAYGGANTTCNSITTASNITVINSGLYVNTLTLGGNFSLGSINSPATVYVVNNLSSTVAKVAITTSFSTSALYLSGTITALQNRAILLSNSRIATVRFKLYYTGVVSPLQTNNFLYFHGVDLVSGTIIAPASTDLGFNSGITFTGQKKVIAFSAYSGAITLPSDLTPGAAVVMWGGGGQAGRQSASGFTSTPVGAGSAAEAIGIGLPLTAGGTIYVNAPSSTGKRTVGGTGSNGGSAWINYSSNTQPSTINDGILAVGGGGSSPSSGPPGQASSCIADAAISGLFGSSVYGGGGASIWYSGGNGGTTNFNRGGGGGGGVLTIGGNWPPGNGGAGSDSSVASGGTSGGPFLGDTTDGAAGATGTGGGGGGAGAITTVVTATGLQRLGSATATVTSPNHGMPIGLVNRIQISVTRITGTYTRSGTLVTVTTSTPHGLVTGNSPYLDFTSGAAVDGTYTATVIDSTNFTVNTAASGSTSGSVALGQSIATTSWQCTVISANAFTFTSANSTNIYAVRTVTYEPLVNYPAGGGNGANSSYYAADVYNGVSYPSKYLVGPGGGGGGGAGMSAYLLGSSWYPIIGYSGTGGDGGIAAGGGAPGWAFNAGANYTYGNGGAGGPGLIIIQYQVAQGTSQAGFVG